MNKSQHDQDRFSVWIATPSLQQQKQLNLTKVEHKLSCDKCIHSSSQCLNDGKGCKLTNKIDLIPLLIKNRKALILSVVNDYIRTKPRD